jgi:V/A-type H+/Na+-transporting ATPase subunit D
MATLSLNKSSLQQQRGKLGLFERFLPSLDLKRQQLTAEYKKSVQVLAEAEQGAGKASRSLTGLLPILGSATMKLSGLVRIRRIDIGEEDVLGVRLPALKSVEFVTADYSLLATPFWIDDLVTCLKEVATYRIRLHVYRERAARCKVPSGASLSVSTYSTKYSSPMPNETSLAFRFSSRMLGGPR